MALPDKNYTNKDFKFRGRLILELYNNKCSICDNNKDWMEIHHIDKLNNNNEYSNLIPVCKDCHMLVHSKRFTMKLTVHEKVLEVANLIDNLMKSNPRGH